MTNGMKFLRPEEYLPRVESKFAMVTNRLLQAIPNLEIEHIGSSAIKGAISKGDLDILLRASKEEFANILAEIQKIGFFIKENTLRTDQLCMLETKDYKIDVAIQLIEKGSKFEMFTKFRDALNSDPQLVEQYNQLKTESSGKSPEQYRQMKSEFIETVLAR